MGKADPVWKQATYRGGGGDSGDGVGVGGDDGGGDDGGGGDDDGGGNGDGRALSLSLSLSLSPLPLNINHILVQITCVHRTLYYCIISTSDLINILQIICVFSLSPLSLSSLFPFCLCMRVCVYVCVFVCVL